jgi:dephospho-CoA kinase
MLSIALTGGIAAGKSLVARRLRDLGATIIDSDVLAREVVARGTSGLAAVVDVFGQGVLAPDGGLDRPALAAVVFGDPVERDRLNGIIHPLVRAESARLAATAAPDAIVVHDIPLLVETGREAAFQLVVVVEAPAELRLERMISTRGMSRDEANARLQAQAPDPRRRAAADVLLLNTGSPQDLLDQVDALWRDRLLPFAANVSASRPVLAPWPAQLLPWNPSWPEQAARLGARIAAAVGMQPDAVDHLGSTAVPGLVAADVVDLQLRVPQQAAIDDASRQLVAAGFPLLGSGRHAGADPGQPVLLHVREEGSQAATTAVALRNWLRGDPKAREDFAQLKLRLAAEHAFDPDAAGYTAAKAEWFRTIGAPALQQWQSAREHPQA